jgi:NAD(P)-dependent dehydrogenase (short-subunit alcohol dehydrogenase family)
MPITLTQHTALITGASRGIGRGIALKLAEQGVKKIAINYKENDAAAEEAARLLKERGAAPLLIKADIGKVVDIQRMFETVKSKFGGLDIFVSNARLRSPQASTRNQWRSRWRRGRPRLTPKRRSSWLRSAQPCR